jgi:hypothetical protein
MKTVYKYKIGTGELQLPRGAKVLTAGIQGEDIFIWAEVDDSALPEHRSFYVYGTGHLIPDRACYIGTVFDWNGFVWHIYEVV